MYITYVKQITSTSLMHETGHSEPVLWDNPEGCGRERDGSGVQDGGGGPMYTHGLFMLMYGKSHPNTVK